MDPLVQEFNEKGYVIVRNVVNEALIKEASDHVEWLQKQNPGISPELLEHWLMRDDPFWVRLISEKSLLDVVERFLGPDIAVFASHYVCKPPYTGNAIHWHQDGSYWPLEPMKVVSVWLAVDHSKVENGCMQVVEGTHKESLKSVGLSPEEFNKHVTEVHMGKASNLFTVKPEEVVNIELRPGDISIHHPCLVHGSQANTSPMRRAGLTIRYIPTSTKIVLDSDGNADKQSKGSLFLLRGKVTEGVNNVWRPWPKYQEGKHFKFTGAV